MNEVPPLNRPGQSQSPGKPEGRADSVSLPPCGKVGWTPWDPVNLPGIQENGYFPLASDFPSVASAEHVMREEAVVPASWTLGYRFIHCAPGPPGQWQSCFPGVDGARPAHPHRTWRGELYVPWEAAAENQAYKIGLPEVSEPTG